MDVLKSKIAYHFKSKHSNYLNKDRDIAGSKDFNDSPLENKDSKKCRYCHKVIVHSFEQHEKSCKLYSKFIKKMSSGFKCLICNSKILSSKSNIHSHIRNKHSNDEVFIRNQNYSENLDSTQGLDEDSCGISS